MNDKFKNRLPKKVVFWTPCDIKISEFILKNQSLKILSEQFPYYLVCSNGIESLVSKSYKTIVTENHMMLKYVKLMEKIENFDVLIRLDADAIVFQPKKLLAFQVNNDSVYGHYGPLKNPNLVLKKPISSFDGNILCGACHLLGKNIRNIKFRIYDEFLDCEFDPVFTMQLKHMNIIETNTFEMNDAYTGKAPVWHPLKDKNKFFIEMGKFENNEISI